MTFAEMTRIDRAAYFNFHGQQLIDERAIFVAALERWAAVCKRCAAFESPTMTAEKFVADGLESTDAPIAEEVRSYIGAG